MTTAVKYTIISNNAVSTRNYYNDAVLTHTHKMLLFGVLSASVTYWSDFRKS